MLSVPEGVFATRWYVLGPMRAETSDAVLLEEIAGGSPAGQAAEIALCRRYAPRIRLYGLRHLRDEDRARDLVQTVLAAVLQAARARRVREPAQLVRFVLGTCRNAALRVRDLDRRAAWSTAARTVCTRSRARSSSRK